MRGWRWVHGRSKLKEKMHEKKNKEEQKEEEEAKEKKKDGPGPVMVSDTLCPAVHILGS